MTPRHEKPKNRPKAPPIAATMAPKSYTKYSEITLTNSVVKATKSKDLPATCLSKYKINNRAYVVVDYVDYVSLSLNLH